ncbi:hypothetical protein HCU40_21830 (plasmid) [Pseudanabaena biceps]|nr:hypothetical protein [Pseudanabaena biceps]
MIKLPKLTSWVFVSFSLSALVSCSNSINPTTIANDASVATTAKAEPSASPNKSISTTPVAQVAQDTKVTDDLLDAAQKEKLRELSVPIVVPNYSNPK